METDKIHERVLEIQKNLETAPPEKQTEMIGELLNMVSQIEQSLADIKIDIDNIEEQIQTNEE
jgi:hypothetical protein